MTANQIAYWNYVENKRSNQSKEAETHRSNLAKETIQWGELGETSRSNRAREDETHRSNVANEYFKQIGHNEAVRHNMATEFETNRSNLANEGLKSEAQFETARHNVASEKIDRTKNWSSLAANALGTGAKVASSFIGNGKKLSDTSVAKAMLKAAQDAKKKAEAGKITAQAAIKQVQAKASAVAPVVAEAIKSIGSVDVVPIVALDQMIEWFKQSLPYNQSEQQY